MDIREYRDSDLNQVIALLKDHSLTTVDLKALELASFVVAVEESRVVGVAGLQHLDKLALLEIAAVDKPEVGALIYQHIEEAARAKGVIRLYLVTSNASDYFITLGYDQIVRDAAPLPIQNTAQVSRLHNSSAKLMQKSLGQTNGRQEFDNGLFCAESALSTIAKHYQIESELIPAIATGLCGGMSHSNGICGALSGSVLGINLMLGRNSPYDSSDSNYAAVQPLVADFNELFGSSKCSELLGCDLGSKDGHEIFEKQGLRRRCREFTGIAADLAVLEIEKSLSKKAR